MKNLILLVTFLVATINVTTAQESVESLMDNALSEAVESDKHVMVKFEASWCGWCHRMTKQLKDPAIASYIEENYVLLPIVVFENGDNIKLENPGSRELITSYKGASAGLPFWVILDASGTIITTSFNEKGDNLGCPASKDEVASFIKKLKATSNLTAENEALITKIFTKG
ncbi:thioredoxin family protein [Nonlabens sp.]|uniref:thioredoxin family protein n=1 Tax=Nonlabens sp. TaxID=1888209 RepID=UPI00326650A6